MLKALIYNTFKGYMTPFTLLYDKVYRPIKLGLSTHKTRFIDLKARFIDP